MEGPMLLFNFPSSIRARKRACQSNYVMSKMDGLLIAFRKLKWTGLALVTLSGVSMNLKLYGFRGLYNTIKSRATSPRTKSDPSLVSQVRYAVDHAAFFCLRRKRCLEKSAAMVLMLRRLGFPAELVIGCRRMPFTSHAWVEVGGDVVNDSLEVRSAYTQLDRF